MKPIRCLLFDLGGTLWSRNKADKPLQEGAANRKVGELIRLEASDYQPELAPHILGLRLRRELMERRRPLVDQHPEQEPSGIDLVAQLLHDWGLPEIDARLLFESLDPPVHLSRTLYPDALQTLAELQGRGYGLGVVSNRFWGGQSFRESMARTGLLRYFDPDKLAISADLGIRKPASGIFQHALDAFGVSAEETVMVGDKLIADMAGAERLGIHAVWRSKPDAERGHQGLVIEELAQLMEFFPGAGLN